MGIHDMTMLTGDHPVVALAVAAALGIDRVLAEQAPDEKIRAVQQAHARGTTVMVGDGINDAPALAAADVGVAMGARGATASSEAADVVLTTDRLDRLVEAIQIAQRCRTIAGQSVLIGMGLSLAAMAVAAAGGLLPVAGAFLQKGIDLLAIARSLRALGAGRWARARAAPPHCASGTGCTVTCRASPPSSAAMLGPLSRTHQEIFHLARLLELLIGELPEAGPEAHDLPDIRRLLYSLHAVLRLHFAQEEELYQRVSEPESAAMEP